MPMDPEKEITIYDLARELNISVATISRALKDDPVVSKKTKKKITDLAEQLGYRSNHFARNLRSQRTHMIGVIIPRVNSYFMSTVIAGIEKVTSEAGYNLIISQSSESVDREKEAVKTMFNNRVDGLLVSLAYDTTDATHFDIFDRKRIPFLFFDRVIDDNRWTSILIDNHKAGYEATAHLIAQGCRRIVHLTAASTQKVYRDRLAGYRQALEEHDIPFRKEYVIQNNLTPEAGVEAAGRILAMKPRPDGVFVANDNSAVHCLLTLKQAGVRIPEDVAFVGFNNDPVSMVVEPNLSTINYPGYEMGVIAARNLIQHLGGLSSIEATNTILLRSELIVRASSLKHR
ncbi:MAG TPA: LacI family DNA-binding transcriptional regulator [Dinghuibacter sp.]|uniref:LacI family DNA-binding transcriptional regulator n=1 Tax=Dinghuibacter sp. TaxID=2024697 RepID=UPI002C6B89CC|nr:LacI family DNA-binding transcriptional regulator [Dinghuibacter sp.]HTJ10535.1 LacI family DNA-binding transcriptional regulator [Dinghuibacter sp.]